jgi:3D-(3,5/4)-trihydroxycyclohexane-1,2-dione acylhydrolase (decyclizing)
MMPSEIVTAVVERTKLVIVLVDNEGYASIGALSRSLGLDGFGTRYVYRSGRPALDSDAESVEHLTDVKLGANAGTLGARVLRAKTIDELRAALKTAATGDELTVIHIAVDRYEGVEAGGAWWDVATPEVAEGEDARKANERRAEERRRQRWHIGP